MLHRIACFRQRAGDGHHFELQPVVRAVDIDCLSGIKADPAFSALVPNGGNPGNQDAGGCHDKGAGLAGNQRATLVRRGRERVSDRFPPPRWRKGNIRFAQPAT